MIGQRIAVSSTRDDDGTLRWVARMATGTTTALIDHGTLPAEFGDRAAVEYVETAIVEAGVAVLQERTGIRHMLEVMAAAIEGGKR